MSTAAPTTPEADASPHTALEAAAARLIRSEEGQEAAGLLHRFLLGAGGSLDASNQAAVMVLLAAAFGPFPGTVSDLLAEAAAGGRIVIQGRDEDL